MVLLHGRDRLPVRLRRLHVPRLVLPVHLLDLLRRHVTTLLLLLQLLAETLRLLHVSRLVLPVHLLDFLRGHVTTLLLLLHVLLVARRLLHVPRLVLPIHLLDLARVHTGLHRCGRDQGDEAHRLAHEMRHFLERRKSQRRRRTVRVGQCRHGTTVVLFHKDLLTDGLTHRGSHISRQLVFHVRLPSCACAFIALATERIDTVIITVTI